MTRWHRVVFGLLASISVLFSHPAVFAQGAQTDQNDTNQVAVERRDGTWTAHFSFAKTAPVQAFPRSALTRRNEESWRLVDWKVLTRGVSLLRIGNYEALVADTGNLPSEVVIAFTPRSVDLTADYDPALIFSDGTIALYTGHFHSFAVNSVKTLAALENPDWRNSMVRFSDEKSQVFADGKRWDDFSTNRQTYILFGDVSLVDAEQNDGRFAAIIDPGLPQWLNLDLSDFTSRLLDQYQDLLGPRTGPTPMVLASWAGPTPEMISMGGSVSPGMVSLRFEGIGLLTQNPEAADRSRWFLAHETAHFWLGQEISHDRPANAWISEGGSDLLAIRSLGLIDPAFEPAAYIVEAREVCAQALANGGVKQARERREQQTVYACGMLFALVVEQAEAKNGQTYFDFVRRMIAELDGGTIDDRQWLAMAQEAGVEADKRALISQLLQDGSADGPAAIDRLLKN